MKKIFLMCSIILFTFLSGTICNAEQEISVYLNDTKIEFDVSPQVIEDRTMVPLRGICESLGMNVSFVEETNKICISDQNGIQIFNTLGEKTFLVVKSGMSNTVNSDVATMTYNGRTLVPVRLVSELLQLNVEWDEKTSSVLIKNTDEKCGYKLTWELIDNTLFISGIGEMYNYSIESPAPWVKHAEKIENVVINFGVTSISEFAFYGLENAKTVEIPKSVTKIEQSAFFMCDLLENIDVNADNKNYMDRHGVLFSKDKTVLLKYPSQKSDEKYEITNEVKEIGADAFSFCPNLKEVEIPKNVSKLPLRIFLDCYNLERIVVSTSNRIFHSKGGALYYTPLKALVKYPEGKTNETYVVQNGTEIIHKYAFENSKNLKEVVLPESLIEIREHAFRNCNALGKFNIPENLSHIEKGAFYGCSSLTSITMPSYVKSIDEHAFAECSNLEEVVVYPSTDVHKDAFEGCDKLTVTYK